VNRAIATTPEPVELDSQEVDKENLHALVRNGDSLSDMSSSLRAGYKVSIDKVPSSGELIHSSNLVINPDIAHDVNLQEVVDVSIAEASRERRSKFDLHRKTKSSSYESPHARFQIVEVRN
jgi:hypothetical protein